MELRKVLRFYPRSTNHKLPPTRCVVATESLDIGVQLCIIIIDTDKKKHVKKQVYVKNQ